jgi:hypothetical protein
MRGLTSNLAMFSAVFRIHAIGVDPDPDARIHASD